MLSGRLPPEQLAAFVGACAEAGLPVFLPVPLEPQALPLPPPEVETVGNSDYVVYQPRKLDSGVLAAKAIADRVLAAVLIVLFAPIMLLVALAVLVSVGRPVLFVQRRAGLYGHPFPMLKFRTMRRRRRREARRAGRAERDGRRRCSRCATTRASRASGASCAAPASTSCRSCSTCCAAR